MFRLKQPKLLISRNVLNFRPAALARTLQLAPALMHNFTPLPAVVGGILIGLSASILLLSHGKVTGISGIVGGLLSRPNGDFAYRIWFVAGLLFSGVLLMIAHPTAFASGSAVTTSMPLWAIAIAGLLVGFGTRLGNGCTSGHGVCGISRLSIRSIAATMTFMATGAATVFATKHILHLGQ